MYTELQAVFTFVSCIAVFFMLSLILGCLSWYWWGGYRTIDDMPDRSKHIVDNLNETTRLEIEESNKDK
tara:strand:+ start:2805 stop:3011 length:207 start_codon:yes stop_codon:yes gene_type:complete